MVKSLPLLLIHCATLHNMVKLSLKHDQDQTGKIMLVVAKHGEIFTPPIIHCATLHNMVK